MSIGYSNIAKSHLLVAVDTDDTQLILDGYEGFSRIDADYTYAVLVNASGDKEIVKVDLSSSGQHTKLIAGGATSYSGGLTVERGQGSTSAASWPRGSLIYIEVTAGFLNEIIQKGQFRTVAYNPNGVLSPAYFGEKVYRSDVSSWFKSFNATDPVWLLIGGTATGDTLVYPGDDAWTWDIPDGWDNSWGVYATPVPVTAMGPTYWGTLSFGTWDGSKYIAGSGL